MTAPAVFRFIADAVPGAVRDRGTAARRRRRPRGLARAPDGGRRRADAALREIGYGEDDLAKLVPGALDQRRLLVGSPKEVGAAELEALLRTSL